MLCIELLTVELLSGRTVHAWQRLGMTGAKGVDVQAPTSGVAGIHRQLSGSALAPNVHEDPLHTLLMEFVVFPKTHQVGQEARLINLSASVRNSNRTPIGLTRDQAVAL